MIHDSFMGGLCLCPECAPVPAVTAAEALRSADALGIATACALLTVKKDADEREAA